MHEDVTVVAVTGGPGSGKSTCKPRIKEMFENRGVSVLFLNEVATELFESGVTIGEKGITDLLFQEIVFEKQLQKEEHAKRILAAIQNPKKLLLTDRGVMDNDAYLPPGIFRAMIEDKGFSIPELCEGRYHGICHLATPSGSLAELYTTANNQARTENAEMARQKDLRTRDAWAGHPHIKIIESCPSFEQKIQRLFAAICRMAGIPAPLEIERKFLIHPPDFSQLAPVAGERIVEVYIEQIYLRSNEHGVRRRIRKRERDGRSVYYYTEKRMLRPGIRTETERQISALEYLALARDKDPRRGIIKKKRHCFLSKNQYFELDEFQKLAESCMQNNLFLLEIELTEENDTVEIPPFIKVIKEVTDDPAFSNSELALTCGSGDCGPCGHT